MFYAFETMLAGRKHFTKMSLEDAVINLQQGAGYQFDPKILAALFTALLKKPQMLELYENGSTLNCLKNYKRKLETRSHQQTQFFM